MDKLFTTKNKKVLVSVGLLLASWLLLSASRLLSIPVPSFLQGSWVQAAIGIVLLYTAFLVWTEY